MERTIEFLTPKNIIYLFIGILVVLWLGVGRIENSLLQFFKPTSIEIENYSIDLHKKHWAYLKEDNRAHYVLGKDGVVTLEVLKDAQDKVVQDEILQCFDRSIEHKNYEGVKGDIIVCELPLKLVFYFKSEDGNLLIRSELNEPMNKYFTDEYIDFLQGVKKR